MNYQFPPIEPMPDTTQRTFWSVMIPTYNGTKYLAQTLESVLQQDPGADVMQIEVVDDCSTTGDVEALVQEIGKGRVSFYRNPQNLGLLGNWDSCIRRARGHWVHLLHQDDLVLSGFYAQLRKGIEKNPTLGAALCRYTYIDDDGNWSHLAEIEQKTSGILINWLERIATMQRVQFPAIVVKRSTYEKIGGFCPQARSAADWEMWKRIAAHYPIWYEPQILACFRLHLSSTSSGLIKQGANVADTYRAIQISNAYFPPETALRWSRIAKENYALEAIRLAHRLFQQDEIESAIAQLKQGLKGSQSPHAITYSTFVSLLAIKKWFEKRFSAPVSTQHHLN